MTAVSGGDALLGELHGLLARVDPVPPQLLEQVRRAFCWRTIDAELAELSFDSLVDREAVLAVRADSDAAVEPRMLGFGAVVDGSSSTVPADELGRFVVTPVPAGPVRLRVEHAGRVVQTTWVSYASP